MPKTNSGRATTITVRVGPNMKREIQRYATAREMTVGEFMRHVLWFYMDATSVDEDAEDTAESEKQKALLDSGTFGTPLVLGEVRVGEKPVRQVKDWHYHANHIDAPARGSKKAAMKDARRLRVNYQSDGWLIDQPRSTEMLRKHGLEFPTLVRCHRQDCVLHR